MASMVASPGMLGLSVARGAMRPSPVHEELGSPGSKLRTSSDPRGPDTAPVTPPKLAARSQGEFGTTRPMTNAPGPSAASVGAASEQAYLAGLAASCLQGDAKAWELLVRREQRRVYGICYRFTGSAVQAEDLTQDTFLKVYRNLGSFDPARASFSVWLTALTRNLLVDHYRRSRLERATDSLDEPLGSEDDGPTRSERLADKGPGQERHVAGLELRAKVQSALARISPELREAVILRDLQDLDYREIAEVLGIPQGTVKSRISRGRAELARLLKDIEGQVM